MGFLYRKTCCLGKNGSIITHNINKTVEELKSWLQQTNKQMINTEHPMAKVSPQHTTQKYVKTTQQVPKMNTAY
jgi:hypothetical protein